MILRCSAVAEGVEETNCGPFHVSATARLSKAMKIFAQNAKAVIYSEKSFTRKNISVNNK
jgi:hypothetical protein